MECLRIVDDYLLNVFGKIVAYHTYGQIEFTVQKRRGLRPFRPGFHNIPFRKQAGNIRFQYTCLNIFCFRTYYNAHPFRFAFFYNLPQPDPFRIVSDPPGDTDRIRKRE